MTEVMCKSCNGRGYTRNLLGVKEECYSCNSTGKKEIKGDGTTECPRCHGTGKHLNLLGVDEGCGYCHNTGVI